MGIAFDSPYDKFANIKAQTVLQDRAAIKRISRQDGRGKEMTDQTSHPQL